MAWVVRIIIILTYREQEKDEREREERDGERRKCPFRDTEIPTGIGAAALIVHKNIGCLRCFGFGLTLELSVIFSSSFVFYRRVTLCIHVGSFGPVRELSFCVRNGSDVGLGNEKQPILEMEDGFLFAEDETCEL